MARTSKVEESKESVELENATDTAVSPKVKVIRNTSSLDDFNYLQYIQYFQTSPEYTNLVTLFENKEYGWKSRARLLMKIHDLTQSLTRLQEEFATNGTGKSGRPTRESVRTRLQENLASLPTDVLIGIATGKGITPAPVESEEARISLIDCITTVMLAS